MRSRTNASMKTVRPLVTRQRLVRDLRGLGVEPGQVLLVHASLKSLGWVFGGAPAVVSALRTAVGPDGHVVVPTGTEDNSRTSRVHRARIATMTPEDADKYEREMPAFNRDTTPSGMGAISEALRTAEGAARSAHPQSSFAAIGPRADYLMADHPLDCHLGVDSPLGRLFAEHARVLMIDVGYWAFTGFHLAEYLYSADPPRRKYACVLPTADGGRCWEYYEDVELDDQEFEVIGESLEESLAGTADELETIKRGKVGAARCRLVPLRPAVEFAKEWMVKHRVVTPR
jgi:aminoglycoside 3-N-acetyltransferase